MQAVDFHPEAGAVVGSGLVVGMAVSFGPGGPAAGAMEKTPTTD
jgi:hypothetical protein